MVILALLGVIVWFAIWNRALKRLSETTTHAILRIVRELVVNAVRGLENAEIARLLGISADGVKKHLKLIYAALGVASRAEASSLALRLGLIG